MKRITSLLFFYLWIGFGFGLIYVLYSFLFKLVLLPFNLVIELPNFSPYFLGLICVMAGLALLDITARLFYKPFVEKKAHLLIPLIFFVLCLFQAHNLFSMFSFNPIIIKLASINSFFYSFYLMAGYTGLAVYLPKILFFLITGIVIGVYLRLSLLNKSASNRWLTNQFFVIHFVLFVVYLVLMMWFLSPLVKVIIILASIVFSVLIHNATGKLFLKISGFITQYERPLSWARRGWVLTLILLIPWLYINNPRGVKEKKFEFKSWQEFSSPKAYKLRTRFNSGYVTAELNQDPIKKISIEKGDELRFSQAFRPQSLDSWGKVRCSVTISNNQGITSSLWFREADVKDKNLAHEWVFKNFEFSDYVGKRIEIQFSQEDHCLWGGVRFGNFKREPSDYNVLLISLDTLRADRLGIAGYKRDLSPNIDWYAKNGFYFSEAVAPSPWTLPSHMSLFTGLFPSLHGLDSVDEYTPLNESVPTLAEIFRENGYVTHAITGYGSIAAEFGFYHGFDQYDEAPLEAKESDIELNFKKAKAWMTSNKDKKFFLFFHTYEIHKPRIHTHYVKDLPPESPNVDVVNAAYDSGVLFTDGYIGKLRKLLSDLGLADNTIVIITSDHGEELFQRGYLSTHGHTLYDDQVKIPLIFYAPNIIPVKEEKYYQAQLNDVPLTLIDMLGFKKSKDWKENRSLWPHMKNKNFPKDSLAFSEGTYLGPKRQAVRHVKGEARSKYIHTAEIKSFLPRYIRLRPLADNFILDDLIKYIHPPKKGYVHYRKEPYMEVILQGRGREYYDLVQDPLEKNNVSESEPEDYKFLVDVLGRFSALDRKSFVNPDKGQAVEGELRERLKALGYL